MSMFGKRRAQPSRRPANKPLSGPSKPSPKSTSKPAPKKPSFGEKAAGNVRKYQARTRGAAAALKRFNREK